jgi:hypothetical protein
MSKSARERASVVVLSRTVRILEFAYTKCLHPTRSRSKPSKWQGIIRDKSQTIKVRLVDMPAANLSRRARLCVAMRARA